MIREIIQVSRVPSFDKLFTVGLVLGFVAVVLHFNFLS